ncbi:hypothetical protein H5410_037723 [Solanum commersonii]|uniref:Uncharacterized protein n=1 Tax=Solanum commersonii TaxID=4109 RepID=A0A9J5Y726_SOLCO|nr:hypothetical protein H5410_037723 [Solanum commersonii]
MGGTGKHVNAKGFATVKTCPAANQQTDAMRFSKLVLVIASAELELKWELVIPSSLWEKGGRRTDWRILETSAIDREVEEEY